MMLEYYLESNELAGARQAYKARTCNVRSYSAEDITDRIMDSGAGLTRSDVVSVLKAYEEVCVSIVAEGGAINTPLWGARSWVRGVFAAGEEGGPHSVRVRLRPGRALVTAAAGIRTRKVRPARKGAIIEGVIDVKTGAVNGEISPGHNVWVRGARLKITGDDGACGLWFVGAENGARVKVPDADMVENLPSRLLAVVPPLARGAYRVEIVSQYNGSGGVKIPRASAFDRLLTVS